MSDQVDNNNLGKIVCDNNNQKKENRGPVWDKPVTVF